MPETETDCFLNLFQLNDRFMSDLGVGDENYEYAEMQLICTKIIKVPPKTGKNTSNEIVVECAYIDGMIDNTYNNILFCLFI